MLEVMYVPGLILYLCCTHINLQKFMIGFVFREDSEAKTFYNHVKVNKDPKSGELHVATMQIQDSC